MSSLESQHFPMQFLQFPMTQWSAFVCFVLFCFFFFFHLISYLEIFDFLYNFLPSSVSSMRAFN
jgi:hypothetical protein